jgi:hypothetical protein
MNEKMNQEHLLAEARNSTQACAHAGELISYLYQEASAAEALDFEQHMRGCVSCRTEFAEFGQVHKSIGDWRTEALGGTLASPATETKIATVYASSQTAQTRQRSALAAIREFFTLSPGWMRAATAFAGLAFCALAIIAFTHLYERVEPSASVAETPSDKVYTKQQVDEMLARAKQENDERKQEQSNLEASQTLAAIASPSSTNSSKRQAAHRSATISSPALANASPAGHVSHQVSTRERQQLAEVLLPQETKDDERLPRLSDLLDNDSN